MEKCWNKFQKFQNFLNIETTYVFRQVSCAILWRQNRLEVVEEKSHQIVLKMVVRFWCLFTLATITKPPFWNWALFNFSCTFSILSFLQKYWDLGEMTLILCLNFYLKVFCPLFIVMACRMFWDWPFCKFVAMHWAAEFKVWCLETWVQCQVLVTTSWRSSPVQSFLW